MSGALAAEPFPAAAFRGFAAPALFFARFSGPFAFFAGAGGLGGKIYDDLTFKSNVVLASALCVLLAVLLEIALVLAQRALTPWTRAARA